MSTLRTLLGILLACAGLEAQGQIIITDISRISGAPGDSVTLFGRGFPPEATVSIDEVPSDVAVITTNEIIFTVPFGARSGAVKVHVEEAEFTYPLSFTVLRTITGQLALPVGVNASNYVTMVWATQPAVDVNGNFSAVAPKDHDTFAWVFGTRQLSPFIAAILPGTNHVVINARTTAEALVIMTPILNADTPERMHDLLALMNAVPAVQTLANRVATNAVLGRHYLDDALAVSAIEESVLALLEMEQASRPHAAQRDFEEGTPSGTRLAHISPPAGIGGYPDLRRLSTSILEADFRHPEHHRLSFGSAGNFAPFSNPVDWFVHVYELDPKQFTNGLPELKNIAHDAVPLKLRPYSDGTAAVSAELISKNLDLVDLFAGAIIQGIVTNGVEKGAGFIAPNEVPISKYSSGVYITEAYSGNIFFGTGLFSNSPANQSGLIDAVGGRVPWSASAAANIFIAAMDAVPNLKSLKSVIAGGADGPDPKFWIELGGNIMQDVLKTVAIHGSDLNSSAAYDVLKAAAGSLIKNLTNKLLEQPGDFKNADHLGQTLLKHSVKLIDISSKVSGALQAVERTTGLMGNSVLALERSVIVVGDPFAPWLESFFPQSGRGGETLTIQGYNFPGTTNNLRVSFCQFASTSDPNLATARIDLQILAANANTIAVRVPTNGPAVFANRRAFVVVEVTNRNFQGTSIPLAPPFHEFEFIGAPEIASMYPDPAKPNAFVELRGNYFDASSPASHEIYIDGVRQGGVYAARTNTLVVHLPQHLDEGPHTIAVRLRGLQTPPLDFEVVPFPASGSIYNGLRIMVTKADFSNAADGHISLLEAALIANGTLGRPIEDHLPCEFLPDNEPGACPFQVREVDRIDYLENSPGGGPHSADHIYLSSSISNNTVATGAFPPFTSGDSYNLPIILQNNGVSDGLVLDGVTNVYIAGLTLRNVTGNGVVLRNGASNNRLEYIKVEACGGSGALLQGNTQGNRIFGLSVSNAALHGLHLSGAEVKLNSIQASGGNTQIFGGETVPFSSFRNCGANGIRIDGGASFNNIFPGTVRENGGAGILITGAGTSHNFVGRWSDELYRLNDVVNNGGPGIHLTAGVQGNIFRYLNPAGNQGDGFLFEGADCAFNQIDRCFPGLNFYEGGTSTALPNQGSGIHLRDGARHNLIGRQEPSGLGEQGSIGGNRDDGILLDGPTTAYNTINSQRLGLRSIQYYPNFQARFDKHGLSGIRIRNGSHNNTIGDVNQDRCNYIFGGLEAGITIEGATTRSNKVYGNQIGTHHGEFSYGYEGKNEIGILLRNGANGNIIGIPGKTLFVPDSFGPIVYNYGNAISRNWWDGIRLENCGGQVGTDGVLREPNVIQNNLIGEDDNGNLGPNSTGITLAQGAHANVIGGASPAHGNRIRGNFANGIKIQNNHVPGVQMRNRILNNVIEETGVTGGLRMPYLTQIPFSGIGLFLWDSSGHVIGEEIKNANRFSFNRVGFYMWNSSNNVVQGNILSNHFNVAMAIYGGSGNIIGGDHPSLANEVIAFGLREPAQSGIALSHTTSNRVEGNIIGHLAPGRGAVGVLLTNASFNQIGHASRTSGNTIISNHSHGILITGADSTGNTLVNNYIGIDSRGRSQPNEGDGVRLDGGAHGNVIGGEVEIAVAGFSTAMSCGNQIVGNLGNGVYVDGTATVGNSILYNRITDNEGLGIRHANGGNHSIPAPAFVGYDGTAIFGTVPDLAAVPPGSTIQVFADSDSSQPEGDAFIGQATVRSNGTWKAILTGSLHHPTISMTATHAMTRSTSQFGTGDVAPIAFHIRRTDAAPEESASAGAQNLPVFRLSLQAVNADVRLKSISFDAAGSLPDSEAITGAKLFHDSDENGQVSASDFPLAGPVTFGAENGRITFTTTNAVVSANTTQKWLLTFNLSGDAPLGSRFTLSVTNAEVIDSEFVQPQGHRAFPIGNFTITSAEFTVNGGSAGQTFAAWKTTAFTAEQMADNAVSGDLADPDSDKLPNLLEYAYALDPLVADRDQQPGMPRASCVSMFDAGTGTNQDFVVVTFVRRKPPVDLQYVVELSDGFSPWTPLDSEITEHQQEDIGDGMTLERVAYRANRPATGPNAIHEQFIRVRVELVP